MRDTGSFRLERELLDFGYKLICGLDEAGRGCLAGPVVAAACILDPDNIPSGIDDSKKLTAIQREDLHPAITGSAISWSIGIIDNEIIDKINILEASKKAMIQAIENLAVKPDYLLIDHVELNDLKIIQKSYIKGDERIISIGAASILAKVGRDRIMEEFHMKYPQYNWKSNKGYPTKEHREAIREYGPCHLHRRTFKGV